MTVSSAHMSERIVEMLASHPPLPSTLQYYDDYFDKMRNIDNLSCCNRWRIHDSGEIISLDFGNVSTEYQILLKHVVVEWVERGAITNATIKFKGLLRAIARLGDDLLAKALTLSVPGFRAYWISEVFRNLPNLDGNSVKSMLRSLCDLGIGPWHGGLVDYVSGLPVTRLDIYKTVRTGDCFVPLDQQALIIDHFDEMAAQVARNPGRIETSKLRDACVLIVSHQHGLRPGQIARIRLADVRLHDTGAVHFSVVLLKQRGGEALRRVMRRVKRDWCPLFIEFSKRRSALVIPEDVAQDTYFALTPRGVSEVVQYWTEELAGESWTPTDLRHSAAQRLADAGVSHIVLSEFMGHASTRTANVYFDTSPTQAQRVNQALALSPIYATVAEVARTRTIDKAALLHLPSDRQIGGVPHGIPIAGIGGCSIGQSACIKNPVLSCYTCRKFMPVKDAAIHAAVVESLRPIVLEFAEASRDNNESPAYTQLRRTLTAALQVAADIKAAENGERGSGGNGVDL